MYSFLCISKWKYNVYKKITNFSVFIGNGEKFNREILMNIYSDVTQDVQCIVSNFNTKNSTKIVHNIMETQELESWF